MLTIGDASIRLTRSNCIQNGPGFVPTSLRERKMNHFHDYLKNIELGLFDITLFVLFVLGLCQLIIRELKKLKR